MLMLAVALAPSWLRPVVGARQHGNEQRYPALFGQLLLCLGRKIVATVMALFSARFSLGAIILSHVTRAHAQPARRAKHLKSMRARLIAAASALMLTAVVAMPLCGCQIMSSSSSRKICRRAIWCRS